MSYVGLGGDYCQETTYRYVGAGAGSFSPTVLRRGCNWCLCLIPLLLALLLIPLVLLLLSSSDTTTTTQAPAAPAPMAPAPKPVGPRGECTIWGDPHLMTFDQKHNDFYSQGEYWIVKSSTIYIQGRYLPTRSTHGLSVTKEIAISGPILNGPGGEKHILRINARTATWDGAAILTGFPSNWEAPGGKPAVRAQYNDQGELLQRGREGKALHIVHVQLPNNIEVQVNRWTLDSEGDYINLKIVMPKQPGQDGHCGNFNGDSADDDRMKIRERLGKTGVDPAELLFHTKTPVVVANRPDMNDCPPDTLNQAEELCKKQEKQFIPSAECLIDVCFGGKHFAQER